MTDEISWSQDMMLEVTLKEPDDFLKSARPLTRIGVASRKAPQTISILSHITQKRQGYIVHFLKNCLR